MQVRHVAAEDEAADAGVSGPLAVGGFRVADVQDLVGMQFEAVEGVAENTGRGFAGAGGGRGDDEFEMRRDAEFIEHPVQPVVEVGNHRQPEVAGGFQRLPDSRQEPPCRTAGIVAEKVLEGGIGNRCADGEFDHPAPPGALGGIAVGMAREVGFAGVGEGVRETGPQVAVSDPVACEEAGIHVIDRLRRCDQGAGGIEQQGLDHGGEPACSVNRRQPPACDAQRLLHHGRMQPHFVVLVASTALCLTACREKSPPPPPPSTELPEQAPGDAWTPLTGQWQQVIGDEVAESDGVLTMGQGYPMTAVRWQGELPGVPFEIEAEARRVEGADFFFSVTFPGRKEGEAASLIVGGWGGGLVGISSIDGLDASENETSTFRNFENGRWYAIRLRVTDGRIATWIDDESVFDVSIEGRELSLRPGPIEDCLPFGVATFETLGELRGMRWKPLSDAPEP